jgi:hypothetical protein
MRTGGLFDGTDLLVEQSGEDQRPTFRKDIGQSWRQLDQRPSQDIRDHKVIVRAALDHLMIGAGCRTQSDLPRMLTDRDAVHGCIFQRDFDADRIDVGCRHVCARPKMAGGESEQTCACPDISDIVETVTCPRK